MALTNGILGLGLCLWLSNFLWGWTITDSLYVVLISNIAALFSVLTTLHIGKLSKWIENQLKGGLRTWSCLVGCYSSVLLLFCPALRSWDTFLSLIFPLILSTGFSILLFGQIQDAIIHQEQRKKKKIPLASKQISTRSYPSRTKIPTEEQSF